MRYILAIAILLFACAQSQASGSSTLASYRQTQVDYKECVKNVSEMIDQLYAVSNIQVISRKDGKATLCHNCKVGQSFYIAVESQKTTDKETIFESKMLQPINGVLRFQSTVISIKDVNGKALVTVTMGAYIEHFWVGSDQVQAELNQCINNVIWKIEATKGKQNVPAQQQPVPAK